MWLRNAERLKLVVTSKSLTIDKWLILDLFTILLVTELVGLSVCWPLLKIHCNFIIYLVAIVLQQALSIV